MFENMTYEAVLGRMLGKIEKDYPNTDTREGSIIFNALAPAAVELAQMYIELEYVLNETFADTATREYLIRRAAERGITPKKATKAVRKGIFNMNVPVGARFSLNSLDYIVTEKLTGYEYMLECETEGEAGNYESGALIPIDYIRGLETAELTSILIPGEDEEATESIRKRYFASLESQAFGGNIADYKEKVNALDGVGGVKVYPAWDGGGTVKLIIINSNFEKPSSALIEYVQEKIDPTGNSGEGVGIAPVGHKVTVVPVGEETIHIRTNLYFNSGYTWDDVKEDVEQAIDAYLKELGKGWPDSEFLIVRISQIETRLLGVAGILDVAGTAINNEEKNYMLDSGSIPVRGDVENG